MDNGNENRRHFLVAKQGRDVIVREVPQGSCAYTLTREEAWKRAQKHREHGNPKKKIRPGRLIVVGLDNMSTETEWPVEEAKEVALDNQPETVHTDLMTNTPTTQPTDKQVALFNKLCTELLTIGGKDGSYDKGFGPTIDRKAASAAIDAAIKAVQEAKRAQTQPIQPLESPEVPAGRYAVTDNEGTLRFFKLDRPTEGRWAGYTFLKIQASDETYPVRDKRTRDGIIALIAQDVKGAMLRYGREIGSCGHCGRTLTDEDSRNAGIGPVCAGKVSWA